MQANWSDDQITRTARRFKAMAQPLRLGIVCLLAEGERSVGEICVARGTKQSNISQHLGMLAHQKILTSRKDANRVYYSIADARLLEVIEMLRTTHCS
jgi:ArsR family transcriptional regulator